ncbi:MAG: ABC transporter ATP-binding protein [Clostridia bacterium]|nr:ABC transporter ATP-binding protein [Clostridia bacterium]
MKRLLRYLKPYTKECVLGPLFKLLEATFELFVPLVIASLIDRGIADADGGTIWKMGALLVGLALVGLVSAITAQYFAAKAATGFAASLKHAVFSHLGSLSFSARDALGTSTMVTRLTSDADQVQNGVNLTLRLFLRSPFIVFGAMVMAFVVDGRAAWIFVAAIPLLSLVVFGIMLRTMPLYKKAQAGLDGVTGTLRENLNGVRVIRAFRQEADETARFDAENDALTKLNEFVGRISAAMNPLTYVILNAALIVLLHTGAVRVNVGSLTQGEVVALVNYLMQILVELIKLANLIITMTRAFACADRIAQVLEIKPGMESGSARPTENAEPLVSLENVSMRYDGAGGDALSGITLSASRGETVGVIGPTGCGKSTLVQLIPRFYDATAGTVRIDGVDVKDYDLAALRRRIGIVPQKAQLFKGTIRDNLLWGDPDATDDRLWAALETAQAAEFVRTREGGLDAPVEQNGRNFSGGQRQRLTIARALVRKPDILILDDSASALDLATDAALRRALRETDGAPVVFIVSQRAASLLHADRILVLEDGRAAGLGTHEELLASCPLYREIYDSQFPKEATAV